MSALKFIAETANIENNSIDLRTFAGQQKYFVANSLLQYVNYKLASGDPQTLKYDTRTVKLTDSEINTNPFRIDPMADITGIGEISLHDLSGQQKYFVAESLLQYKNYKIAIGDTQVSKYDYYNPFQSNERLFIPPTQGIKFHTTFYRDISLLNFRFDLSDNIKYMNDISNAEWSNQDNRGITIVSVQTVNNFTTLSSFNSHKLSAYTLQFNNWDFSANLPLSTNTAIGDNGINIFNKASLSDNNTRWDPSSNMIVGIPTNYIQDGNDNKVNFPVAISSSDNNMNALNIDISFSQGTYNSMDFSGNYTDLYAILGKPNLVSILNAYDENLDLIQQIDISFERHNF